MSWDEAVATATKFLGDVISFNAVSLAIAVLGVLIAIYTYQRTRTKRVLVWARTHKTIITSKEGLNDLEIRFKSHLVKNVSITRLAVWNAGNTAIRADEIVEGNELRIAVAEGAQLLSDSIVNVTSTDNALALTESVQVSPDMVAQVQLAPATDEPTKVEHALVPMRVVLSFRFLEPGDGAVIQLITDSAVAKSVKLEGRLIGTRVVEVPPLSRHGLLSFIVQGVKAVKSGSLAEMPRGTTVAALRWGTLSALAGLGLWAYWMGSDIYGDWGKYPVDTSMVVALWVGGVFFGLLALLLLVGFLASFSPKLPRGLETIFD
jgi:hypothetical protein